MTVVSEKKIHTEIGNHHSKGRQELNKIKSNRKSTSFKVVTLRYIVFKSVFH